MTNSAKLKFADVKRIVGEHLKIASNANVKEFSLIFAKQEGDDWKVNVEYVEKKDAFTETKQAALFKIDGITGEVKEFQKGGYWRF